MADKEIRFKLPDWFDTGLWLGIAGVLGFLTSWFYVHSLALFLPDAPDLGIRFHGFDLRLWDLAQYFDILDYVQITPVGGITFLVFSIVSCVIIVTRTFRAFTFLAIVALLLPICIAKIEAKHIKDAPPL
jgi:hypothetical protein